MLPSKEWLATITVGSEVGHNPSRGREYAPSIHKVARLTRTRGFVLVNGYERFSFRLSDGRIFGFYMNHILEPTAEFRAQVRKHRLRVTASKFLNIAPSALTDEECEAVIAVLQPIQNRLDAGQVDDPPFRCVACRVVTYGQLTEDRKGLKDPCPRCGAKEWEGV